MGNDWIDFLEVKNARTLEHHGILGMKWGKKNGPPYPLSPGAHSASEKKAGWKKSLSGGGSISKRKKLRNDIKAAKARRKATEDKAFKKYERTERQIEKPYKRGQALSDRDYKRLEKADDEFRKVSKDSKSRYLKEKSKLKSEFNADKASSRLERKANRVGERIDRQIKKQEKRDAKLLKYRDKRRTKMEKAYDKDSRKLEKKLDKATKKGRVVSGVIYKKRMELNAAKKAGHLKVYDEATKALSSGGKNHNKIIDNYKKARMEAAKDKSFKRTDEYRRAVMAYNAQKRLNRVYGRGTSRKLHAAAVVGSKAIKAAPKAYKEAPKAINKTKKNAKKRAKKSLNREINYWKDIVG